MTKFQNRIVQKWVAPEKVLKLYFSADYGLLIRESSVTNKVASPVKFSEYLAAGLKPVVSGNIGDFSELVEDIGVKSVLDDLEVSSINFSRNEEKLSIRDRAVDMFKNDCIVHEMRVVF